MIKIIAELGQGYEGNAEYAKLLARAAIGAGANIVKFQLVYADDIATPDNVHYNLFRSLELSNEDWNKVKSITDQAGVEICFDIFGNKSLELAKQLNVNMVKLHPTDMNNIQFLNEVNEAGFGTVFIGVGGASKNEIENAVKILCNIKDEIVLLLGFQSYPTENADNQISRLNALKLMFQNNNKVKYGFADHVVNNYYYAGLLHAMALVMGATFFEKHLSFGNALKLEDYESAIQPDEFRMFVSVLNDANDALGKSNDSNFFGMSNKELEYRRNIRRTWVASTNIKEGEFISYSNVSFKRCGQKIENDIEDLIGKKATRDILKNEPITIQIVI